jgi:hypothetical protein
VAERGDDAGVDHLADQLERPGKFRRHGHDSYRAPPRPQEPVERISVGSLQVPWVLCTAAGRSKEWTFQVDSGEETVVGKLCEHSQ